VAITPSWSQTRRAVIRDALGIGIAAGAYGVSFGAISVSAGLSVLQTCALAALMFTGASQITFVSIIAAGGSAWTAASTAALLGTRNALYGVRLSSLLEVTGARRFLAAHFVIDETTAMAIARDTPAESRLAFWITSAILFSVWNVANLVGALATEVLPDPKALGLDAAPPAAFLALIAPRLRAREPVAIALAAGVVALALVPFVPPGVPLLVVAVLVVAYGLRPAR
jgi:predicted branched-subunit amino acid permease